MGLGSERVLVLAVVIIPTLGNLSRGLGEQIRLGSISIQNIG